MKNFIKLFNQDLLLKLVQEKPFALTLSSDENRIDREIVMQAVEEDQLCSNMLQKDSKMMRKFVNFQCFQKVEFF